MGELRFSFMENRLQHVELLGVETQTINIILLKSVNLKLLIPILNMAQSRCPSRAP